MKKFFQGIFSRSFNAKNALGQVRGEGRFDKSSDSARRRWGLAIRLKNIRNRGKK